VTPAPTSVPQVAAEPPGPITETPADAGTPTAERAA
jgi:hypothetical protein